MPICLPSFRAGCMRGDVLMHSALLEIVDACRSVFRHLSNKGSKHTHIRYYADINRIKQILSGSAVYLADDSHWNDRFDACNFNPYFSSFKCFGICMSYSASESIAMWMLYGGHSGAGAMIDFERDPCICNGSSLLRVWSFRSWRVCVRKGTQQG